MWNTSQVTTLESTFHNADAFNSDLSAWDVSKVTTLHSTFKFATLFNSNISNWATSKVVSLVHTFDGAAAFNGGKCPSFNGVFDFIHKKNTTDLLFLFLNYYKIYPNGTCPRSLNCITHLMLLLLSTVVSVHFLMMFLILFTLQHN